MDLIVIPDSCIKLVLCHEKMSPGHEGHSKDSYDKLSTAEKPAFQILFLKNAIV